MSSERGISTVVDVMLCLLIVSAAIGMLVYMEDEQDESPETAGDTAAILGTATASIEYTPSAGEPVDTRTDYGTIASLLAKAAVLNGTVKGEPLTTGDAYQQAAKRAAEQKLVSIEDGTEITARWEPIENGSLQGKITVGERPPPGADVDAAVLTVTTGQWDPATLEEPDLESIAVAASRAAIDQLFDPQASTRALESTHDERTITLARYHQAAAVLDVELAPVLQQQDAGTANALLADALGEQLLVDIHNQYDQPDRAAAAITPGEVTIIIRRWK